MDDEQYVLGFIGAGFVGGATIRAFSGYNPILVYDKGKNIGSFEEVCWGSDIIFISLPTPMSFNGECDTRLIRDTLYMIEDELQQRYDEKDPNGELDPVEVVIRSTTPPNFCREIQNDFNNFLLLTMPEFLTERTADIDFITAPRYIIGSEYGDEDYASEMLTAVLKARFPRTRVAHMTWEEASMVKYATNAFFTVKLSYFNELHALCEQISSCNSQAVLEEVLNDGRIGRSHFKVPGPDGDYGWGGHCFPKDNRALSAIAESNCSFSTMIDAAWEVNEMVRSDRDWEEQVGRAVNEEFHDQS